MTMEAPELLGRVTLSGQGVSASIDNIILLRYVEIEGRLGRAISVLKMRGSSHETQLRQARIDDAGMHVGQPFRDYFGVLTGIPQPVLATPAALDGPPEPEGP